MKRPHGYDLESRVVRFLQVVRRGVLAPADLLPRGRAGQMPQWTVPLLQKARRLRQKAERSGEERRRLRQETGSGRKRGARELMQRKEELWLRSKGALAMWGVRGRWQREPRHGRI